MFLIRAAFWLGLLVLLLPTDEQQQKVVYGNAEATVKDLSAFCVRNPDVCEASKHAAHIFSKKAQFGAKMLMDFIQETAADNDFAPTSDDGTRRPSLFRKEAQGTLTANDLRPSWSIPSDNGV
ncbi:MAG: DUF5330 domain-containing protein [Alphaproteobacteria bacterium]|jgi:hypothetical protein